jgi:hypothetical protein
MSFAAERTGLRPSCLEALKIANAETLNLPQNGAIVRLRGVYATCRTVAGLSRQQSRLLGRNLQNQKLICRFSRALPSPGRRRMIDRRHIARRILPST